MKENMKRNLLQMETDMISTTLDRITHHRLNQVISVASELADSLVDVDLALLL